MENSFKSVIDQSRSILILLPTKPFFDQVAAGLSLYLALRDEKGIQIYSPSPMTVEFNRLIGVNKISQEMGNKNLIIRFVDYKASDIERVSYDIEDGEFRLTVIPKQKINPPVKEQVELSYSGISVDTVVMIGGANESHFPAISSKDLSEANIVHLGTRDISLSSNKSYVSFSRPASSISEIVGTLIKESGFKVDEDIATNLIMGVEEASNNLTDPMVNADTFAIIADLMRAGGKRTTSQSSASPDEFPPGAIPGQFAKPRTGIRPQQAQKTQDQQLLQHEDRQTQVQIQNEVEEEEAPKDWLQPKIYKGTSTS